MGTGPRRQEGSGTTKDSPVEAWLPLRAEEAEGISQGEDPRLYPPVPVTVGPTAGDTWEISSHVFPNLKGKAPLLHPPKETRPTGAGGRVGAGLPTGQGLEQRRNNCSAAMCPFQRPQLFDMEVTGDNQILEKQRNEEEAVTCDVLSD